VSRRARARAGAMLAKRFHVEMPPEDDFDDDEPDQQGEAFDAERETEARMPESAPQ
jgi:hypothetical protein